jgi:hypothetical protein
LFALQGETVSLLDQLAPITDTPIRIGAFMRHGEGVFIPFFCIDFGQHTPSYRDFVVRNSVFTLDIVPALGDEYTFHLTGDRRINVLTPKLLEEALGAPSERLNEVLFGGGRAEFASSVTLSSVSYDAFIDARDALSGDWMLIILSQDATELVIDGKGKVARITTAPRAMYAPMLE